MSFESRMSRRTFMRTMVIAASTLATTTAVTSCNSGVASDTNFKPRTGKLFGASFDHGVASGDPLHHAVILWTRVSALYQAQIEVRVEVALDSHFTDIVASGVTTTDAGCDFTVKFDITGLTPATRYYYRFHADGSTSETGITKTLAEGALSEARLAVVSCSNYPAGHFHVYAELARRDDLDAVVHLGDYIYEYEQGGYATEQAARIGREPSPLHETVSLSDYRTRYAQYRSDDNLKALHAKTPFILIWDDHEIANDTWQNGAENHSTGEGAFATRKADAIQAWYEWLPVREPADGLRGKIYRSFEFGDLLAMHMLDTRVAGRDAALNHIDYFNLLLTLDEAALETATYDPERQMLGQAQEDWLLQQMAKNSATWQVLGQQVLMARMDMPTPLLVPSPRLSPVSFVDYAMMVEKSLNAPETLSDSEQATLNAPTMPYNLDAWDGYAAQRERLLEASIAEDANLIVLAGDTHNAWASNLQTRAGIQAGVEFATASVSSPGLEAMFPDEDHDLLASGLCKLIPTLAYCNARDRGYMVITLTHEAAMANWHYVSDITTSGYTELSGRRHTLQVLPGAGNRSLLDA